MSNNRGGLRPGSGRKPRAVKLSNYDKALNMLDNSICTALDILIKGLKDKNKNYRYRCAELLLKKALPDKLDIDENYKHKIELIEVDYADND